MIFKVLDRMPINIVLGNRPDWVELIVPRLGAGFKVNDELLHALLTAGAEVIAPLDLSDYDVLRANSTFLKKALIPSAKSVRLCNDKQLFRDWFLTHFDHSYLPLKTKKSKFSIAKPRIGVSGVGSRLIESTDLQAIAAVESNSAMCLEDYIFGSKEFAFHILFDQDKSLYAAKATHLHKSAVYIQGSNRSPPTTFIETCTEIPPIFIELLRKLNYSGTACIDYKFDETGQIKILEVNPRIGFSLISEIDSYMFAYANHVLNREFQG
jgi:carbamoylphosphate synthase large subunit